MTQRKPTEPDAFSTQPLASSDLHTLLVALLSSVCANASWEYGESWIPIETTNVLELGTAWCLNTNLDIHQTLAWTQFQICSKSFVLHLGEGLPGRVWQTQQPEWNVDVSTESETYFLRNQIARAFNVRAGLGIPLLVDTKVLAVAVFFKSVAQAKDDRLIQQTQDAIVNFRQLFPRL